MFRRRALRTSSAAAPGRRLLAATAVTVLGGSVGLGAVTAPAAPAGAATNCAVDSAEVAMDGEEQKLFWIINEYRRSERVDEVFWANALARPATWMSRDSAGRGFAPADHVDTFGRWIDRRVYECDYRGSRFSENLYYGTGSGGDPYAAFYSWRRSEAANAVMLDPNAHFVGISRVCTDKCFYTLTTGDTSAKAIKKIGRAKR